MVVSDHFCCRPRDTLVCGPQWEYRSGPHHDPRWYHGLLTSVCPSLLLSPQFTFLLCAHILVSLSLPFFYLVVPRVSECLGSSQSCSAPTQACTGSEWCSSQASSLSRVHGTGLMLIMCSLLAFLRLSPHLGSPMWLHMSVVCLMLIPARARGPRQDSFSLQFTHHPESKDVLCCTRLVVISG